MQKKVDHEESAGVSNNLYCDGSLKAGYNASEIINYASTLSTTNSG
jgi:hypothetical protein